MRYKISNVYIKIGTEEIAVGTVLGEDDKPHSPFSTEYITNSEYEKGLKDFSYGRQQIGDLVYHQIAKLDFTGEPVEIEKRWIDELILMGYDVSKLRYRIK